MVLLAVLYDEGDDIHQRGQCSHFLRIKHEARLFRVALIIHKAIISSLSLFASQITTSPTTTHSLPNLSSLFHTYIYKSPHSFHFHVINKKNSHRIMQFTTNILPAFLAGQFALAAYIPLIQPRQSPEVITRTIFSTSTKIVFASPSSHLAPAPHPAAAVAHTNGKAPLAPSISRLSIPLSSLILAANLINGLPLGPAQPPPSVPAPAPVSTTKTPMGNPNPWVNPLHEFHPDPKPMTMTMVTTKKPAPPPSITTPASKPPPPPPPAGITIIPITTTSTPTVQNLLSVLQNVIPMNPLVPQITEKPPTPSSPPSAGILEVATKLEDGEKGMPLLFDDGETPAPNIPSPN